MTTGEDHSLVSVSPSSSYPETSRPASLDPNTRWVYQNIKVDPDSKYSFAVRASNVQGESRFSVEKIKELKGLLLGVKCLGTFHII